MNCVVLWLFAKVFSTKFWGVASFGTAKASNLKVFSAKIVFFTNSQKFSPSKVFRYTVDAESEGSTLFRNLWAQDCGDPRLWRPKTVATQDCGDPRLWRPKTVAIQDCGDPRLWRPKTVATQDCGDPRLWRPKTVATQVALRCLKAFLKAQVPLDKAFRTSQ